MIFCWVMWGLEGVNTMIVIKVIDLNEQHCPYDTQIYHADIGAQCRAVQQKTPLDVACAQTVA